MQNLDENSKILLNNLTTIQYKKFNIKLKSIFHDYMQDNRNEAALGKQFKSSLVKLFVDYYNTLAVTAGNGGVCGGSGSGGGDNDDDVDGDGGGGSGDGRGGKQIPNLQLFSSRYVIRPQNNRLQRPYDGGNGAAAAAASTSSKFIAQPLYCGYRLVICTAGNHIPYTRCFNRHGSLIKSLLYDEKFNVPATFEAILMPVDGVTNELKNWRTFQLLGQNRTQRQRRRQQNYAVIVVDVFCVNGKSLLHYPFRERVKFIGQINGDHVRAIDNSLIDTHAACKNLFSPCGGIVYRRADHHVFDPADEFRYPLTQTYRFSRNTCETMVGGFSLLPNILNYDLHICFEMADYRTVCMAYNDDEKFLYICRYHRKLFQFVHVGQIEKLPYDSTEYQYPFETLYVINAKIPVKGVLYFRVYYNIESVANANVAVNSNTQEQSRFSIVGYESKLTTTRHDLSADSANTTDLFPIIYK